jgi:hypothetical protein
MRSFSRTAAAEEADEEEIVDHAKLRSKHIFIPGPTKSNMK